MNATICTRICTFESQGGFSECAYAINGGIGLYSPSGRRRLTGLNVPTWKCARYGLCVPLRASKQVVYRRHIQTVRRLRQNHRLEADSTVDCVGTFTPASLGLTRANCCGHSVANCCPDTGPSEDHMTTMQKRRAELVTRLRALLRTDLVLTRGERLMLGRRDEKLTQRAMAAAYEVGVDVYRAWERDDPAVADYIPIVEGVRVASLSIRELLFVHRTRAGVTLEEVAEALGRSSSWVHHAEKGNAGVAEIVDYVIGRQL